MTDPAASPAADPAVDSAVTILEGDCLQVMPTLESGSVDLIVADPPYHGVKADEAWDQQWATDGDYLAWLGRVFDEWRRVLKANGSLYCFASPRMAARVECAIGERFEVLNSIVWLKADRAGNGQWKKQAPDDWLRCYFPQSERIIFAEHFGADSTALGESCWGSKCDELRGFVFESLLLYLSGEFEASGLSCREVDDYFGTANVSQYWRQRRGFIIPTAERYAGLRRLRPGHFCREYEDLRREYESLRREYESLRRPFAVDSSVPYTDVWDFPTVPARPDKHPCEKSLSMIEHIIAASSRPDALVLDPFVGSGTTAVACANLGRRCIGIESDPHWAEYARRRVATRERPHAPLPRRPAKGATAGATGDRDMPLFRRPATATSEG